MQMTLKVFSCRRNESPADAEGLRSHTLVVDATQLPSELEVWRSINPRDPNARSRVSRDIRRTLIEEPKQFYFRNRGLVLLASSLQYDNKTSIARIRFEDSRKHGLLDGGHTYRVIQQTFAEFGKEEFLGKACVKLDVMTGFNDIDDIVGIVEARNLSRPVPEEGLDNQQGRFDAIKRVLRGTRYQNLIAFKDKEEFEGTSKPIGIKEVISCLICFDIEHFDRNRQPVAAYGAHKEVLQHYRTNLERMERLSVLLPDILDLWDVIYGELPRIYNEAGGKNVRGNFGHLIGVKVRKNGVSVPLSGANSNYEIPRSYIYPLLAACRTLVQVNADGNYSWKQEPFGAFRRHARELVQLLGKSIRDAQDPRKLGRDSSVWQLCYFLMKDAMAEAEAA